MFHESALQVLPSLDPGLRLPVEDEVGGGVRPQVVLELLAKLHPPHDLGGREVLEQGPEDETDASTFDAECNK